MPNDEDEYISPDVILNATGKVIREIIIREFSQHGDNYKDFTEGKKGTMQAPDKVLDVMTSVVEMIKDGKSIQPHQEVINQLIENQTERAQLFDSLHLTHEYDRFVKFLRARKCIEDLLLAVAERGELSPAEALALHGIISKEVTGMQKRVGIGAMAMQDILGMLNKVDWVVQRNEQKLQKDFSGTNPQGREIARKCATALMKITKQKSEGTVNEE